MRCFLSCFFTPRSRSNSNGAEVYTRAERRPSEISFYQAAPSQSPRVASPHVSPHVSPTSLRIQAGIAIAKEVYQSGQTPEKKNGLVYFREKGKYLPPQIFENYVKRHLVNYKLLDAVSSEDLKKVRELVAQKGCCLVMDPETGKEINLVTHVVKQLDKTGRNQGPLETFHHWGPILEELRKCPNYEKAYKEALERLRNTGVY